MNIELHLFASLTQKKIKVKTASSQNSYKIGCPKGSTIEKLINQINLPKKDIKIIFVNGKHATLETVLKDGDRVGLFPAIGGG